MDLFFQRYSHRGEFTQKPVSREDLTAIVKAGLAAPSGKNQQTAEFVIVDDQALLKELACIMGDLPYTNAPAAIIVVSTPKVCIHNFSFHIQDASAAIQSMLLAIAKLGYASLWAEGVTQVENRPAKIRKLLGIPDEKIVACYLPIGEPKVRAEQPEKKSFEERAWFNGYKK